MTAQNNDWSKNSWHKKKALHQPVYHDEKKYNIIIHQINNSPPLVFTGEVNNLKRQIAEAGTGKRFILQGGDCAERFIDCNEVMITNKIKILLQMSVILTHAARKPIIRIGRIAGQYFKPRSNNTEIIGTQTVESYKGDSINDIEPDITARTPDPERLIKSYYQSALTLNYIRALISGGFADLHQPYSWNLYAIEKTDKWCEYKKHIEQILDSIYFMESFGGLNPEKLGSIEFFTSHEGLHLGYEEAMTRKDESTGLYYNLGSTMLWIGERTRDINGAHVEYFRGIANPIGIKIGPGMNADELTALVQTLNPKNEPGKITLITRMGVDKIGSVLPKLVQTINKKQKVTWSCDPMHGNTITIDNNLKTRNFNDILNELKQAFLIHKENKSYLAGVHFELTGEDVTECTGGAINLKNSDLNTNYQTYCDPRLNYAQSLEMAFLISNFLKTL